MIVFFQCFSEHLYSLRHNDVIFFADFLSYPNFKIEQQISSMLFNDFCFSWLVSGHDRRDIAAGIVIDPMAYKLAIPQLTMVDVAISKYHTAHVFQKPIFEAPDKTLRLRVSYS